MERTAFRAARDLLLECVEDYERARAEFSWPQLDDFNWALDHFDAVASDPKTADRPALWIVDQDGGDARWTYAELSARSNQTADWLRQQAVARGDRVIVMLGNQVKLWEVVLAATKLGAVIVPATPLFGPADLRDRIERGAARHVVVAATDVDKFAEVPGDHTRIAVGAAQQGWLSYAGCAEASEQFSPDGVTHASDTLLLYFTSGTTAVPSWSSTPTRRTRGTPVDDVLDRHSARLRTSQHLLVGLGEARVEQRLRAVERRSDGVHLQLRQVPPRRAAADNGPLRYDTFCAPSTVWRMLIQADLGKVQVRVRELVGAGGPLNPEVIEQVEQAWGIRIGDRFGQTETTVMVANTPGQPVKPGSMGRPVPGYDVMLLDPVTAMPADEGEFCIDLSRRPFGLMVGYADDPVRTEEVIAGGSYHTGDVATQDGDGDITYVGRADDVFKASDYRISPFELESVLIEHDAVAEAAAVPRRIRCDCRCPRLTLCWRPGTNRPGKHRFRCCCIAGSSWRRTNGFACSNSASCPRRSRARSGGWWSCGTARLTCPRNRVRVRAPSIKTDFPEHRSR